MKKLYLFTQKRWLFLFFISFVPYLNAEEAPFIIAEQGLSFGTLAIGNRRAISSISIDANGRMSTTNNAYVIKPGQPAKFTLMNYLPYRTLYITTFISRAQTTTGTAMSNQFTLKEITSPVKVVTDSTGSASFYVGGRLETSGDASKTYYDTLYQAKYVITVNY